MSSNVSSLGMNETPIVIELITRNIVCSQLALISCLLRGFVFRATLSKTLRDAFTTSRNISRVPKADSDEVASVVVSGTMFTVANGTGTTFNV